MMLVPDQLAWILEAPSAVWPWDGWLWGPGAVDSVTEGAHGAVSECFSWTEQSRSELGQCLVALWCGWP